MDIPPPQDSTKHILNVLNNDCIVEIFRRIQNIEDFLNAAEVCKRFQESAKECFRSKYSSLDINIGFKKVRICLNRANALLEIFGPMIECLSFHSLDKNDQKREENILKSIVRNCAKTLKELDIKYYRYQDTNFEHTSFEVLENLHLSNTTPKNLRFDSPLKWFSINRFKMSEDGIWFMRKMPKLERLGISCSNEITNNIVSEFLSLNPHLERISLSQCAHLSPLILKDIAKFTPNLIEFNTMSQKFYEFPNILNENIIYLCSLRNLKDITIDVDGNVLIEKLINMFAENNIPIEKLTIWLSPKPLQVVHRHKNLKTINTLKYLTVNDYSFVKIAFSKILLNIVRTQTALETFDVDYNGKLSILLIKSLLKHGTFSKFKCILKTLSGDLNGFKEALFYAKHRIHVTIKVLTSKTDYVPENVLDENREWINISYVHKNK